MNITLESIFVSRVGTRGKELLPHLPRFLDLIKDGVDVDLKAIAVKMGLSEGEVLASLNQVRKTIFDLSTPDGVNTDLPSLITIEQILRE